jgi:hypothetical protein
MGCPARDALDANKEGEDGHARKLKVQKILSALTVAIGFVLMSGKIYADSEPGAIPILLVVLGTGWYIVARARTRSHRR